MRVVIKIGSNILADAAEGLNVKRMAQIADRIAALHNKGHECIIVSSGAVAAGRKRLGIKTRPAEIKLKQAVAAVGQSALMQAYEKVFGTHKIIVAQMLLTRDTLNDRNTYLNTRDTLLTLLEMKVVPVINENDTVATEEIKFGDNDRLAAMVASLAEAERLVILSDVDGLYTANPATDKDAELIPLLHEITPEVLQLAGGSISGVGTGGMYSKVEAAKIAMASGVTVHIINGKKPANIGQWVVAEDLDRKTIGTTFMPQTDARLSSRKGWIAYGIKAKGTLVLDDGAVRAIVERQKSLLPSGVVSIEGTFERGDAVKCMDRSGRKIAKGLTNYSSADMERIKGKKTSEITEILGYNYSDEVLHRDNMVVLT